MQQINPALKSHVTRLQSLGVHVELGPEGATWHVPGNGPDADQIRIDARAHRLTVRVPWASIAEVVVTD